MNISGFFVQSWPQSGLCFIEDMPAFVNAFAFLFLFFQGQVKDVQAIRAAAAFEFRRAHRTLDEQQMTGFVLTIGMGVSRLAALMTAGDDLFADPFSQAIVMVSSTMVSSS